MDAAVTCVRGLVSPLTPAYGRRTAGSVRSVSSVAPC